MEKLSKQTEAIMRERFGKDSILALATEEDGVPHVRNVDAYYEDGAFYVITYALSNKMRQIAKNPVVALAGDWFTAHGKGENLGYFGKSENAEIAGKLREAFAQWIDNGHNDFADENTCILRIELTDGVLYSDGKCYEIDFRAQEKIKMDLPIGIQRSLKDLKFQMDNVGLSDSRVYLFDDQVLKIGAADEESENEYRMMQWLTGKLPVPQPVACECENKNKKSYLLMTRLRGKMACDDAYMRNPEQLTGMLAEALKRLWAVDVRECPCVWTLDRKLAMAEYRVEHGMVSTENVEPDTYGPDGFASPNELLHWLTEHKPKEEPILSHGDFCLPNIFFENGRLEGYIDLGRMGTADRWQDIALCYRSLKRNYDGMYGGRKYEGFWPEMFFDKLGMGPDWEKIRYYILLDELF